MERCCRLLGVWVGLTWVSEVLLVRVPASLPAALPFAAHSVTLSPKRTFARHNQPTASDLTPSTLRRGLGAVGHLFLVDARSICVRENSCLSGSLFAGFRYVFSSCSKDICVLSTA